MADHTWWHLLCLFALCLFMEPTIGSYGICVPQVENRFTLLFNEAGFELCGVSTKPARMLEGANNHGDCLMACASFPGCSSYNFFRNSTRCELFDTPARHDVVPYCSNFVNSVAMMCPYKAGNWALRRPAFQSSTYQGVTNNAIYNANALWAVDGNANSNWGGFSCSSTSDAPGGPNWLVVDLGCLIFVDFVAVTNRGDCCGERLDYFLVGLSKTFDQVTNPPIRGSYALCGQYPTTAGWGARLTVTCAISAPSARYVIIQQPANGVGGMAVCELEVYER